MMFFTRIWKCYDVASIERIISRALEHYADREDKEMVVIPFDILLRVVESALDNDSRIGEIISDFVDHFDEYMSAIPMTTIGAVNLDEVDPKPALRSRKSVRSKKTPAHEGSTTQLAPEPAPAPPASTSFADIPADDEPTPMPLEFDIVEVLMHPQDVPAAEPSSAHELQKADRYRARKRAERLGLPIPAGCEKKTSGRPLKYANPEERAAANAAKSKRWREKQPK